VKPRNTEEVLQVAETHLTSLVGHVFDLITVSKPVSPDAALNLSRVVSKLSPLLGNLIEFNLVEILNEEAEFSALGKWERQDPGFPDTIFRSKVVPTPGIEIKAWFPLATEITARFRDSQNHFKEDNTRVAMLAWLPENLIYGKPKIVDVCVVSAASVAAARDKHYHTPPEYLVIEPEDTSTRTRNLQQTNTAGYRWQGGAKDLVTAREIVESWGRNGADYKPTPEYQRRLRELMSQFTYRLDTNFAKMDRIMHPEIEDFKDRVCGSTLHGMTILSWAKLLLSGDDGRIRQQLQRQLGIKEAEAKDLIE